MHLNIFKNRFCSTHAIHTCYPHMLSTHAIHTCYPHMLSRHANNEDVREIKFINSKTRWESLARSSYEVQLQF